MRTSEVFCRLYIYSHLRSQELQLRFNRQFSELIAQNGIEFFVRINDEFDEIKAKSFPDGFLFFNLTVEVYSANIERQMTFVTLLLQSLWKENIPAIAACDYEDQLPEGGGYKSSNVPWI